MPQHDRIPDDDLQRRHTTRPRPPEPDEEKAHPLLGMQHLVGNEAVRALVTDEGHAVDPGLRHDVERTLGTAFDDVRVHTGPDVDRAAEEIDAAAFTVGTDIFVHSAVPEPTSDLGRTVITEELAHVAQGVGAGDVVDSVAPPDSAIETEAKNAVDAVAAGERASISPRADATAAVARFDFGDILDIFGGQEARRTLSQTQANQITNGVLPVLTWAIATAPSDESQWPSIVRRVDRAAEVVTGMQAPAEIKTQLDGAAEQIHLGSTTLWAVEEPLGETLISVVGNLAFAKGIVEGIAGQVAPEGQPPTGDQLSTEQANYLRNGVIGPLEEAVEDVTPLRDAAKGNTPPSQADLQAAASANGNLPAAIGAADVPEKHRAKMTQAATTVRNAIAQLTAVSVGKDAAVGMAVGYWAGALGLLSGVAASASSEPPE